MSRCIWEQESNMKHLQSGCNHVQHIQVASSNLLSELWRLALKFVLLCLQISENPKKKVPTISITSVTIISKKKWLSAYKVRFIQKSSINILQSGPCPPSPVAISPPPLLSCSYSSSQLEPRRDFSISANRAASRNFSLAKSTRLLWKKDFLQFQEIRFNKIKHIQRTKTLKTSEKKLISHAFFKSSSSCFSRAVLAACRRSNLYMYKMSGHHLIADMCTSLWQS